MVQINALPMEVLTKILIEVLAGELAHTDSVVYEHVSGRLAEVCPLCAQLVTSQTGGGVSSVGSTSDVTDWRRCVRCSLN